MPKIKKTDLVTVFIEDLSVHPTKRLGFKDISGVTSIDEAITEARKGNKKVGAYKGKLLSYYIAVKSKDLTNIRSYFKKKKI